MPFLYRIFILFIGSIFIPDTLLGQTVTVKTIEIYGLKRTKEHIVHRELTFQTGDSLDQMTLGDIFERNRHNLLNLGIFNEVEFNIREWDTEKDEIDIVIEFTESWYIYAVPVVARLVIDLFVDAMQQTCCKAECLFFIKVWKPVFNFLFGCVSNLPLCFQLIIPSAEV